MNPNQPDPNELSKPVAYDTQGRPLYLHPAEAAHATPSQSTQAQATQAQAKAKPHSTLSAVEVKTRHEQSKKLYPKLNLSGEEYVIMKITRYKIGLIPIWGGLGLLTFLACIVAPVLLWQQGILQQAGPIAIVAIFAFALLLGLFGYIATFVFNNNKLFLTNEAIIQQIQHSLFSQRIQHVGLEGVEDVSFRKNGIIQYMFDYGNVRLSTVGAEHTYRLTYVKDPRKQAHALNSAVERFKRGHVFEAN